MDAYELLKILKQHYPLKEPYWWAGAGSFEIVVGAVLTQQTKWENVERSLKNLLDAGTLELEKIASSELYVLEELIRPSGFYRKKAKVLKTLCENIVADFGDFEAFKQDVDRQWLLSQKGIGAESSDSILNYACFRDVLVVDSYTNRVLANFGYEFESYDELQEYLMSSLDARVYKLYPKDTTLAQIYARFHGKIVEFCKEHLKGKNIDESGLELLKTLK